MLSAEPSTVDRLVATLVARRVRRTWPLLTVVPPLLLRRLLTPTVTRLRRSVERTVLWLSLSAGATIVVLELIR